MHTLAAEAFLYRPLLIKALLRGVGTVVVAGVHRHLCGYCTLKNGFYNLFASPKLCPCQTRLDWLDISRLPLIGDKPSLPPPHPKNKKQNEKTSQDSKERELGGFKETLQNLSRCFFLGGGQGLTNLLISKQSLREFNCLLVGGNKPTISTQKLFGCGSKSRYTKWNPGK